MKIIQQGNLELLKEIRQFHCKDYDCIFEANNHEYRCVTRYQKVYYYCECPVCGNRVFIK